MQRRKAVRALVLSEPDHRVLLLRMQHPDRPGEFWLLPGGGVKPHETPVEASRQCLLGGFVNFVIHLFIQRSTKMTYAYPSQRFGRRSQSTAQTWSGHP